MSLWEPGFSARGQVAATNRKRGDDISRPRTRHNNYVQLFKKDVVVSGTVQAVRQLGGIGDEMGHQRNMRLREIVRDLEKATIRGRTSGNTIGAVGARRSMDDVERPGHNRHEPVSVYVD